MKKNNFAIIVSQFNEKITAGLLDGAKNFLLEKDISPSSIDVIQAPGAFEIPIIAKNIALSNKYSGVIALGCVIKGETAHFEYISMGVTNGLMNVMLETGVPVGFGVITTYNAQQALDRSQNDVHNKGLEAAQACFETVSIIEDINK